ncbi:lysozyme inhibitor LprI family protein [Oleiagrimonas sp. MCCC 1A03011]|jgi:uncharacterized protein YecT (DUF1311 family)|uniref:lysozyme inhibitor LprI family protein n=1 Tax=Oleiagrimonas sp. MCCC 1A03011 TaxID=1926883 RepID=UPI00143E020B|nr:lysozyme inhibitor LprI family protein [Oleiagrimonas sp. MCCC 1A03011]
MNTGLIYAQKERTLVAELQDTQRKLFKLVVDGRLVHALRVQEKAWSQYKVAECDVIGELSGGGGSWPSTKAVECEMNLTSQRLHRMRDAVRCVRRVSASGIWDEKAQCLYQLAPLAVPLEK